MERLVILSAPLDGIRVLDLSRVLSGPFATMTLADLGAEVIKVEAPGKGDDTRAWGPPFLAGESTYFLAINRSKLGITLDFKKPRGRELLHRLLELSDILIENFRPGALEKIGLGYEGTHKLHPRLIYCSISGYGHTGPRRMEPGYDVIIQGESGVMSVTGAPDGPPFKMGISIADITCGMYAVQGILAALYHRERTGEGQKLDIALLDSMVSTLTYQAGIYFATGQTPRRMGNRHPSIAPYETFGASDGHFNLGIANDTQWRTFCAATGLESDPRFATIPLRVQNYDALRAQLDSVFRQKPVSYWIETFRKAGLPCGEVRNVPAALGDPQLRARNMILEMQHPRAGAIRVTGSPIKMSATDTFAASAPPVLGEHNRDVFCGLLGLSGEELEELQREQVI
ncbi:MAG: formyl-CoA transferase [Acidobacteria bacterium]|nr:MAG: formyl-CoA transferase [Acidobacteriota bacterium]